MNAIYVRVSTDEQAHNGYSLSDQLHACRKHLLSLGHTNIREYVDDGYSGEFMERPGLERLRNDLTAGGVTAVAVFDPDRLSRNLINQLVLAEEIEKSGAKLTFVTGDYDCSPEGRLFFSLKGAVAAYEKAKIRERTSRGRRAKALQGKIVLNAHPFGYDWDAKHSMYIINAAEASTVRLIYELCLDNGYGAGKIAKELILRGITGKNHRPLSLSTITRILTKKMYCGEHTLFRQTSRKTSQHTREVKTNSPDLWIRVRIPAIISPAVWEAAQQQIQKNKLYASRNTKNPYLLQGLLYCALCGRSMTAVTRTFQRKNGNNKTYQYYTCITRQSSGYAISQNRCHCRNIPAPEIETAIWETCKSIAANNCRLQQYLDNKSLLANSATITAQQTLLTALQKKKSTVIKWYHDGLLDGDAAEKELLSVKQQLALTRTALAELIRLQENINLPGITPADWLDSKTFTEKRRILLKLPYRIYALRLNEECQFWLKAAKPC
jgi:DNA invertase Pin-like site-specific DNA recombinase